MIQGEFCPDCETQPTWSKDDAGKWVAKCECSLTILTLTRDFVKAVDTWDLRCLTRIEVREYDNRVKVTVYPPPGEYREDDKP